MVKKLPLGLLVTFVALPAIVAHAGPKDRYAVVTLENKTPYRVDYSYVWGGNGNTRFNNYIKPNSRYAHTWKLKYQGDDFAPWFYIEPEGHTSPYRLRSFFSPDTKADGNGKIPSSFGAAHR